MTYTRDLHFQFSGRRPSKSRSNYKNSDNREKSSRSSEIWPKKDSRSGAGPRKGEISREEMASLSSEKSANPVESSPTIRPMSGGHRAQSPSAIPPAIQCSYAACYCEENVWKICHHLKQNSAQELDKVWAVFISNKKRVVPLWKQKAGRDEEKLVIWDYHVIALYRPEEARTLVYDLDSELPFPTYFHKYVTETFRTDAILNPEYHRIFRVVPASTFLTHFSSDRRHMRKSDGSWLKPPPPYPCIQGEKDKEENEHNLEDFISMEPGEGRFGEVLSLTDFVRRFHQRR